MNMVRAGGKPAGCRHWQRTLLAAAVLVISTSLWVGTLRAQPAIEREASILVFPKVIANGARDTIIQIANTSDALAYARCWYVEGDSCRETSFEVTLTAQQPTHWVASTGRPVDPLDPLGSYGAGLDPGLIPPTPAGFRGALVCVEVDGAWAPMSGNRFTGQATLKNLATGDVATYNAIGFMGSENNGDGTLVLGGGQCVGMGALMGAVCTSDEKCGDSGLCVLEYDGCPQTWTLNHLPEGAQDGLAGASSSVRTDLTIMPCSHDYLLLQPGTVALQFLVTNEFEQMLSVATMVSCWANRSLSSISSIFDVTLLGGSVAQTTIRPATGWGGVVIVGEEFHLHGPAGQEAVSSAGVNLHHGNQATTDVITSPGWWWIF